MMLGTSLCMRYDIHLNAHRDSVRFSITIGNLISWGTLMNILKPDEE
jgi:hypothetical protein